MGETIKPKEEESKAITPRAALMQLFEDQQDSILAALPKHLSAERMIRVARTAISKTPALWECPPQTVVASVIEASQMGLEVNGHLGEAALVPFYNKKTRQKECQLMVQYRGYIELAERSGKTEYVDAQVVYEGDVFEFEYGTNQHIRHVPKLDRPPTARPIAVYGFVTFRTGKSKFVVLSVPDVEKIRACSKAADAAAWKEWWDEMAKKTALRRLFKYVPLSSDVRRATLLDDATDGGVRPGDAPDRAAEGASVAVQNLRGRLSGVAESFAEQPEDPELSYPACDDDGVVDVDFEIEEDGEPNEPGGPIETPPHEYDPSDPAVFGESSKFYEKVAEMQDEFLTLATEGQGLSDDEAEVKWRAKVMKLLGSEGVTAMGELDQKGKNAVVKGLAAAIKDYTAALNARDA